MGGFGEEGLGEGADGFTRALFVLSQIGEQLSPRSACLGGVYMQVWRSRLSMHTVPRPWELVPGPQGMLIWILLTPFGMSWVGWGGPGLGALRGLWDLDGDPPVRKEHLIQPGGQRPERHAPGMIPTPAPHSPGLVLVAGRRTSWICWLQELGEHPWARTQKRE